MLLVLYSFVYWTLEWSCTLLDVNTFISGYYVSVWWKLVIHGCMDGYSRLVVYLHCANNNEAATVFGMFQEAVMLYGFPSRVRSDRGSENIYVADFVIAQRASGRGSFICGRSVHNQRIEHLWRDVFRSCTVLYYQLFQHMEENGLLDIDDEVQLFCLQYIFLPRINESLQQFVTM